jgi:hypothetical protein
MEQSNSLDTVKLKKVVTDIFAGGEKSVEEFDCSAYTDDELDYIVNEMQEQTIKNVEDFAKLIDELIDEYDEKEN